MSTELDKIRNKVDIILNASEQSTCTFICAKCIISMGNKITANVKKVGCKMKSCVVREFSNLMLY